MWTHRERKIFLKTVTKEFIHVRIIYTISLTITVLITTCPCLASNGNEPNQYLPDLANNRRKYCKKHHAMYKTTEFDPVTNTCT